MALTNDIKRQSAFIDELLNGVKNDLNKVCEHDFTNGLGEGLTCRFCGVLNQWQILQRAE
jgi:hypothetical protein